MVQAVFSHEMREVLKNMAGHEFISYEYGEDAVPGTAYGNIKLNFDDGSIDLRCEETPLPFFGEMEDVACFTCRRISSDDPFVPAVITSTNQVFINERIVSVSIITDNIDIDQGKYNFVFDVAVIIHCEHHTIMFARGIWFSEVITISYDDDYEMVFPMQRIIESWSNEGEYDVQVQRSYCSLE